MRGDAGEFLWTPLQPVEAIELIHQLAASVGCHINLQPRDDFSSWREWRSTNPQTQLPAQNPGNGMNTNVGYSNEEDPSSNIGAVLPHPSKQPGFKFSRGNKHDVATEKTVDKRSTKRATKAS